MTSEERAAGQVEPCASATPASSVVVEQDVVDHEPHEQRFDQLQCRLAEREHEDECDLAAVRLQPRMYSRSEARRLRLAGR